ncbi:autotransporter outer membrane beta-barrel domain-containing protein [Dongia soli]|uniref:Autotransporter outer membrane beta-barrel domain-containing protein n=1 Tax=Dongia soli TaxID=600628 RepID=A0ABU5EG77_9PROT|nr:autotransporter outer membrane beta-barrel domain-containing protein [Dongia soli]MDY0884448.1 autotransporter outer membrane beta-barrel domain-containing protein [Dongia soli]
MRKYLSHSKKAACAALLGILAAQGFATTAARADNEVEKKIREEVSRRVSDAVSNRISDRLSGTPSGTDTLENSAWITASYTSLTSDNSGLIEEAGAKFQSDVVNTTFGADHRFGDSFFLGLSGSYTHASTDTDLIGFSDFKSEADNDSYTISPYAAYVITPNFFMSGLFSYTYSDAESETKFLGIKDTASNNSQTFGTEIAANGVYDWDKWLFTGKAAWRFNYTELLDNEGGGDDDVHANSAVLNAEVGYRFDRFLPYFQVQYEHVWPEKFSGVKQGDNDYVFLTGGLRAAITDTISAGASVKAEVLNDETNQVGGAAEFRVRF